MTDTLTRRDRSDPLGRILPSPHDRDAWELTHRSTAVDTGQVVAHYRHRRTQGTLRLDDAGRVYGQDVEGVVRLFGRGGPLALHVALNIAFDGHPDLWPTRVVVPRRRR